ncbi:MFS transporter [Fusibacter bizertensis]
MNKELKNLWLTLCGKGVSLLGSKLFGFAMSFYILKLTGSAQSFAISLLITTLPMVVLSPIVGGVADRFDRKIIVVGADFISGVAMLAFFFMIPQSGLSLPMIYFAEFILAVLFVFLNSAFGAAYPNIVSRANLTKINAYSQGLDSILSIMAPILGGIIYGLIDVKLFFMINAISFILSSFSELFIDFHMFGVATQKASEKAPFIQNLKEGFRYVAKQKTFMTIAIYALVINFFLSGFSIILPVDLINYHGISPQVNGIVQAAFPVGAILMSIYVGKKNIQFSQMLFKNSMLLFSLMMFLFAVPVLPFIHLQALVPFYYGIAMIALSMVVILVNVPLQVLFQVTIEDAYRGRAMGVLGAMSQGIMPIAYLLTGVLMDFLPSYSILIFDALALSIIAISVQRNANLKEVAVTQG